MDIKRFQRPMNNTEAGILIILALVLIFCLTVAHCEGQFIGYVSPQTVQQTLGTSIACTGSTQTFNITNLGQTQHYLSVSGVSAAQTFIAQLQGVDTSGNVYPISDPNMLPLISGATSVTVRGSGYYAQIQAVVTCTPATTATFNLNYSGAWGTFDTSAGSYALAQIEKPPFTGPEGSNLALTFQTPFGSSAGQLIVRTTVGASGGSIAVTCQGIGLATSIESFTVASSTNVQVFQIADYTCPFVRVAYSNNGSGTGTITADYWFSEQGRNQPAQQYAHITGSTASAVKAVPGYLHTLTINTGASGTVSIFDLASASCTSTPSTNTVAVITVTTSTLQTFTYDTNFLNGICVKASATMDLTVSYQ